MSTLMQRISQTWVKTGGRWLLVDWHVSGMPGALYTQFRLAETLRRLFLGLLGC